MTETSWKIIVQVFSDTKSSPETLLFTVDFGGDYELGAIAPRAPPLVRFRDRPVLP